MTQVPPEFVGWLVSAVLVVAAATLGTGVFRTSLRAATFEAAAAFLPFDGPFDAAAADLDVFFEDLAMSSAPQWFTRRAPAGERDREGKQSRRHPCRPYPRATRMYQIPAPRASFRDGGRAFGRNPGLPTGASRFPARL